MLRIRHLLLIKHVQKLTEELLELHIIVELTLSLSLLREEYFEVGVQHVVTQIHQEDLVYPSLCSLDFVR